MDETHNPFLGDEADPLLKKREEMMQVCALFMLFLCVNSFCVTKCVMRQHLDKLSSSAAGSPVVLWDRRWRPFVAGETGGRR